MNQWTKDFVLVVWAKKFRHSPTKHGICFSCVVMLTQLAIEHGSELFSIQYDDWLTDATAAL